MWKKKIAQKKIQFILISIILMVSSSIFATSISFTSTVSKHTENYYKGENIKDIVVQTYNETILSKIENFIKEKELEENDIRYAKGLMIDRQVFLDDKNLGLGMANLVTYESEKKHPWDVVITKGEKRNTPSEGSIWVTNILADDKNLNIGDRIRIKDGENYKSFKISALVNDSLTPSSLTSYNNLYINNEDYKILNNPMKSKYIGYDSSKEGNDAILELTSYIGGSVEGIIYDKWITIFSANATSIITGAIGMSTAMLIFILSIIIIRFILWNNILKEYKSIGIYKSLGFTSKKIRNIYLKSYGIVGIIAISLGSFLSITLINYMVRISVKYIGIYISDVSNTVFIGLTIVLMSFILMANICFLLRRLRKIKPVEALRIGVNSSKEKFKKSKIEDAFSPLSMAINDIFKYRKQNLIIVMVLSFVMYLSSFLVTVNYSMNNAEYNAWNIFGILQGDITIDFPTGDSSYNRALDEIKKDSRVLGVRESSIDIGKAVYLDISKYNIQNAQVATSLYDNYDNREGFNVSILEGRNPKSKNEVAVTDKILKGAKLSIGDYIKVKILGEEKSLLITGRYASMISNNHSMRMTLDVIPKESRNNLDNLNINVTLKDKMDYEDFKKHYNKRYEISSMDICPSVVVQANKSVVETIVPITTIILLGILLFSVINIINIIMMNNTDNRRNNSIMKSLGFSNIYILKRTLYRIIILTTISALIGFTLNTTISKPMFKILMMEIDGLIISQNQVVITILFISILTIVTTIITMFNIKKISTVELMEE